MKILVLGAAAGGGFPQWNSNDAAAHRARAGDAHARPQSQSSIAVSADGQRWVLFNASPDLRQQINDNAALWPGAGEAPRASPLAAVVLTNADVDHVAGPAAEIHLHAAGISRDTKRVLIRHYRIDQTHSNAYTVWKQMGSPQKPNEEQYKTLEAAGQLQLLSSPHWTEARNGAVDLQFSLPLQGLSLVQLSW